MTMIGAISFGIVCSFVSFVVFWIFVHEPDKRHNGELRNSIASLSNRLEDERERARNNNDRANEFEKLFTTISTRSEGYSAIITKLLDGSRKASDEYEKVRRAK